jgi:hypothetical protein
VARSAALPVLLSGLLLLLSFGAAAEAHAGRRRSGPGLPLTAYFTLGVASIDPNRFLFDASVHKGGIPDRLSFPGRELGYARPTKTIDAAVHILGCIHHVVFGQVVGMLFDGRRTSPLLTDDVPSSGTMGGYYTGPEVGTAWSRSNFDFRATASFGYRSYNVPLTGFDLVPCGKAGYCEPTLGNDGFFFRPVVTAGFHWRSVVGGAYAGGDVMPGGGWVAGAYFGISDIMYRKQTARAGEKVR